MSGRKKILRRQAGVLDIGRPELDVSQALSLGFSPGKDEGRLGKVESEHLPVVADHLRGGDRGGAGATTCVEDALCGAHPDPGDRQTAEPVPERQCRVIKVIGGGRVGGR
jgi:hypothetical protein